MANIKYVVYPREVVSNEESQFYVYFDTLQPSDSSLMLYCHLFDPKLKLDYYLDGIPLSSMQDVKDWNEEFVSKWNGGVSTPLPSTSNYKSFKMTFPDQLAGGKFVLVFYLEPSQHGGMEASSPVQSINILDLKNPIPSPAVYVSDNVYDNHFTSTIKVKYHETPCVKAVFFADDADIKYGKEGKRKSNTSVRRDDMVAVHFYTEGCYGADIPFLKGDEKFPMNIVTIYDNVRAKIFPVTSFLDADKIILKYLDKKNEAQDVSPALKLDKSEVKVDSPSTSSIYVSSGGKTKDWDERKSFANCRVDFRPPKDYDGSFGFSWYRVCDTGTKETEMINDSSFTETLGYHINEYTKQPHEDQNGCYRHQFTPVPEMSWDHTFDYERILIPKLMASKNGLDINEVTHSIYLVPQMTIRKGKSANLVLYGTCEGDKPEEYKLEFDNPNAEKGGFLSVDKKSLSSISNGSTKIKISCNKEFSKMVRLNVYAYSEKGNEEIKQLCGSVCILPNDVMHQRDVALEIYNIRYVDPVAHFDTHKIDKEDSDRLDRLKDEQAVDCAVLDGMTLTKTSEEKIQNIYGQAYLNVHIIVRDLDLDNPNDPIVKSYIESHPSVKTPMEQFKEKFESFVDEKNDKNVLLCLKEKKDPGDLFSRLRESDSQRNEKAFPLYLIPMRARGEGGYYHEINGSTPKNLKYTCCYYGCDDKTPIHEYGHVLSLPHTFFGAEERCKYSYQYHTTDNIMDYSSHKSDGLIPVERQSLFYWQWKMINQLME